MKQNVIKFVVLSAFVIVVSAFTVGQVGAVEKPNILVIMSDDVGVTNISAYSRGLVGYQTPNIDRIATEGMLFTDYYAEQSCTAGRSTFITGQSSVRTGLTKVGLAGATLGLTERGSHIGGAAQKSWLCVRAVREEPSR